MRSASPGFSKTVGKLFIIENQGGKDTGFIRAVELIVALRLGRGASWHYPRPADEQPVTGMGTATHLMVKGSVL